MQISNQFRGAQSLERYMGDPADSRNAFSFARAVELDERDEYPEQACDLLDDWGLNHYYIPKECAGELDSYPELIALLRLVARRDVTLLVAYIKSFLGAAPVWVAGNAEQKQRLAAAIKSRKQIALAYHEKPHGSDMLANEVSATQSGTGYLLSGEKWLVNNATRSSAMTLFARTDERGGPRGFSLFLVEKDALDSSSYKHLPRLKTHGVRGAEFSGIRFNDAFVAADAHVGPIGSGLETSLLGFQVTRTIVPSISLGAADTALRATMSFALNRKLYGDSVFAIPHARDTLVGAFLDLLICDCLAISTARALHAATGQMRLWSSLAKYYIPTATQRLIDNLSVILGARYYLREGHWSGIFQKIVRDNAVVSLFHAGTFLNLITVAIHLKYLADHPSKAEVHDAEQVKASLESIFSLEKPLAAFDPKRLSISSRGRDDVTQGLALSLDRIRSINDRNTEPEVIDSIARLSTELLHEISDEPEAWKSMAAIHGPGFDESPEMFELAKRHCALHAAAACVHTWVHNRSALGGFFAGGEWLALCLDRLLNRNESRSQSTASHVARVASELERLTREDKLFSIVPLQLAGSRAA